MDKPTWFIGTESCIDANLFQMNCKVIDYPQTRTRIMAHIRTVVENEQKKQNMQTIQELRNIQNNIEGDTFTAEGIEDLIKKLKK